jgi:mannose/fructose/N-acetylgalactosamine-specific phosphotransferase system component IIC
MLGIIYGSGVIVVFTTLCILMYKKQITNRNIEMIDFILFSFLWFIFLPIAVIVFICIFLKGVLDRFEKFLRGEK